ncbi:hypothetical protein HHI36_018728 [Cryptolaemus montrouzieri]|uniref:Kazal-like domain-containing protein n=1 Tax=Cryptolaemus montrouzieri TaxID=559131 RepID=A0ABD2P166_9CUCU
MFKILILVVTVSLNIALSQPALIKNGRMSGMDRLNDPKLSSCLSRCPVTLDLNPQCASDGKSYANLAVIDCMKKCTEPSEDFKVVSSGYCPNDVIEKN